MPKTISSLEICKKKFKINVLITIQLLFDDTYVSINPYQYGRWSSCIFSHTNYWHLNVCIATWLETSGQYTLGSLGYVYEFISILFYEKLY